MVVNTSKLLVPIVLLIDKTKIDGAKQNCLVTWSTQSRVHLSLSLYHNYLLATFYNVPQMFTVRKNQWSVSTFALLKCLCTQNPSLTTQCRRCFNWKMQFSVSISNFEVIHDDSDGFFFRNKQHRASKDSQSGPFGMFYVAVVVVISF